MSYKTLILVDNSNTMTTLNREIISQTIRYILLNADDDSEFSVASSGEKINYYTAFEDSLETKLNSIEYIKYEENVMSHEDALMEVISEWKEKDFAGRSIVLISDGHKADSSYTKEELYFELSDGSVPIYVIGCVQDDNESDMKSLASIGRISKGSIFYTEFEGSDSAVEEQIGQKIFEKMKEYRNTHALDYVNQEGPSEEFDEQLYEDGITTDLSDKIYVENEYMYSSRDGSLQDESVIYEMPNSNTDNSNFFSNYIYVIGFAIALLSVLYVIRFKRRRKERDEEEIFLNSIKTNIQSTSKEVPIKNEFDGDSGFDATRSLIHEYEEDDGGTRLLFQSRDGVDITLEDRADPTKYFRACIKDRIVIGRNKSLCDIALSYDDSVSSRHCEMFLRGNELYVRDLSSSNGTLVNQQKVYQEIKINSGDILKLGQLSLYVQIIRRDEYAGI